MTTPLTPSAGHERWRRIEELCHAALAREPAERSAFLVTACTGDEELRSEVEALLAHDQSADAFLVSPVAAVVAPDGRFLMIKPSEEEQASPRLNVVLNWVDELTRRVPTGLR